MSTTILAQDPTFAWAKGVGGVGNDFSENIVSDQNGNIIITGRYSDTVDFDPGPGIAELGTPLYTNVFIEKLDASGNLLWVRELGSQYTNETIQDVVLDSIGNCYLIGGYSGTMDFDPGPGVSYQTANPGVFDVFIVKLDSNGNFLWAKSYGGQDYEKGWQMRIDNSGDLCIAGQFVGTADLDPGLGVANYTSNGEIDVYVLKLDINGNFIWAKTFGGSFTENVVSMETDLSGNIFITGTFQDTVDFNPSAAVENHVSNGADDIYIQKLDANGNLLWVRTMGSTTFDAGLSLDIKTSGSVVVVGVYQDSVDFDTGLGTMFLYSNGDRDVFVFELDPSGNTIWAKSFGGSMLDWASDVLIEPNGDLFISGYFSGQVDFDPGPGTSNYISNGSSDAYLLKLNTNGNYSWVQGIGGSLLDKAYTVTSDQNGHIYTTGYYSDTVDFDPGAGTFDLTSNGGADIFVQKLLTVVCQPTAASDVHVVCDSYTWIDGITYTSSDSTATHVIPNAAGCDSTITLNLTVNSVSNLNVTINDATLSADLAPAPSVTYNWLDCDNGFAQVGVITQAFSPSVNGNYAVQLGQHECLDTSACFLIDNVGLSAFELTSGFIRPNPTNDVVTISFESSEAKLTILDLNGKVMTELTVNSGDTVDMSSFENGVYLFTIYTDSIRTVERVVKQ